jgi:thiol-disulfide isomerase/thioredoxin
LRVYSSRAPFSGKAVVVSFWATGCAYCLKELPILHNIQRADKYGVKGIPHRVIVGKDGRVVAVYTGYSESSLDGIVADINRALAAPKPAAEADGTSE